MAYSGCKEENHLPPFCNYSLYIFFIIREIMFPKFWFQICLLMVGTCVLTTCIPLGTLTYLPDMIKSELQWVYCWTLVSMLSRPWCPRSLRVLFIRSVFVWHVCFSYLYWGCWKPVMLVNSDWSSSHWRRKNSPIRSRLWVMDVSLIETRLQPHNTYHCFLSEADVSTTFFREI